MRRSAAKVPRASEPSCPKENERRISDLSNEAGMREVTKICTYGVVWPVASDGKHHESDRRCGVSVTKEIRGEINDFLQQRFSMRAEELIAGLLVQVAKEIFGCVVDFSQERFSARFPVEGGTNVFMEGVLVPRPRLFSLPLVFVCLFVQCGTRVWWSPG